MDSAWLLLYNFFVIPVFWGALRLASVWNEKIRRGLRGRKRLFSSLQAKLALRGNRRTFWVHVSSMGEFEQAKPILERIKNRHPETFVFVSFFSPSGFDHSQDYSFADAVAYLPFDSYSAARKFVAIVRPDVALFIRYELWLNHLHAIRNARVPLYLACTSARSFDRANVIVRSYLGAAYRQFNIVFCNDESDRIVFAKILGDPVRCLVTGDTRFDRVMERAAASRMLPPLQKNIVDGKCVLVAGSTWPQDEEMLFPVLESAIGMSGNRFLCVLAPHEPSEEECLRIESRFSCCRFSRINAYRGEPVILVDSVGRLVPFYQHATIAFVGGGFGAGVHSVLEPAAFGVHVYFGPRIERSPEAQDLIAANGGMIIHSAEDLRSVILNSVEKETASEDQSLQSLEFVRSRAGASDKILQILF